MTASDQNRRARETITAEERLDRSVPVRPGGTLFINADRGRIDVYAHAADEVSVEAVARGWRAGLVLFTLEPSGDDVHFDIHVDGFLPGFLGAAHISVRIFVPARYSVDIESRGGRLRIEDVCGRVDAHSSGGHIDVSRVDGPVTLRTSGGHVTITQVDGDVRARTSGGHVQIEDVRGDVAARTSGGHVRALYVDGQVDLHSSGGAVKVSFVEEACGRCETSGGHVEVSFPEGAGVDLDARTSGGSIQLDHEIEDATRRSRSRIVGRVNGGGAPLHLRSSGGHIKILAT